MDVKSFFIGVASPVLAAGFIYLLKIFFASIKEFISGESKISGKINGNWKAVNKEPNGNQFTEEVFMRQFGKKVWGVIKLNDQNLGYNEYKFNGIFKSSYLVCTFASKNITYFEMGTIILKYEQNRKLIGKCISRSKDGTNDDIISSDYVWTKQQG